MGTDNNLRVAWPDTRNGNYEIYYAQIDSNGNPLTNDTRLTSYGGSSQSPSVAVAQNNGSRVVWYDSRHNYGDIYYKYQSGLESILEWSQIKIDGSCIYDNGANGNPNLADTAMLKCFPADWVLKNVIENGGFVENDDYRKVIDTTDGITGWMKISSLDTDTIKQVEWEKKIKTLDPNLNPGDGGTVPGILEAVDNYYNNIDTTPSLYSGKDRSNKFSIFKNTDFSNYSDPDFSGHNHFPVELILSMIANETGSDKYGKFDNEWVSYDYGHGVTQVTAIPEKNSGVRYLQIILNSDLDTRIATSGAGSPGNETRKFGDLTRKAVIKFQEKYASEILTPMGLTNGDGIVGKTTRDKLNNDFLTTPGIPSGFTFKEALVLGSYDTAAVENRGNGSGLLVPPCMDLADASSSNYISNCYSAPGSYGKRTYVGNPFYNNRVFKYYSNTPQSIYADIKDGLKSLRVAYSVSINNNKTKANAWIGALWRYNHGLQPTCPINSDRTNYLYNAGVKLGSLDSEPFYFGSNYKEVLEQKGNAYNFLDADEKTALANKLENYQTISVCSPVELRIYDSQGRVAGMVNGEVKTEIPDSDYDQESILLLSPEDSYTYEVVGEEGGVYHLTINSVAEGASATFTASTIPISQNEIHQYTIDWQSLQRGEEGVTLKIDYEGDGIFDKTVVSDRELSSEEVDLQTKTIIDVDPDTLNLKSNGNYVTAYIELPKEFDLKSIDKSSIKMNETMPSLPTPATIGDYDHDGIADLMVKFDANKVRKILKPADKVEITVSGKLSYGQSYIKFKGADIIKVIK
jgi:peptidoglycan hydrolase-like protein with peptidoglycan-binding domain